MTTELCPVKPVTTNSTPNTHSLLQDLLHGLVSQPVVDEYLLLRLCGDAALQTFIGRPRL